MTDNKILHFWLDHLEIYWTFKDEALFDSLDFDNSNYAEFEEYNITKNEVSKFQYKIIFTKDNYSLFAYYKWIPKDAKHPIATKDYIVFYSTAFKLLELEEILYFLQTYLDLKHNRRFDICIDIKEDIDVLLKKFNNYTTWREYRKSWKTETIYIWEVSNVLNKRQLIRIYNKIKDIVKKKKTKLYGAYLLEDYVTRVELEIRQELAKNINYLDLFTDNETLQGIFKNYLSKHTEIFDEIPVENLTLYRKRDSIDPALFQSTYYKHFKANIFLWHAKTVFNFGYCPIRLLIWEWLIQHRTSLALWIDTIDKIIEEENRVKRHAQINRNLRSSKRKRKKDDEDSLKDLIDNYPKYE